MSMKTLFFKDSDGIIGVADCIFETGDSAASIFNATSWRYINQDAITKDSDYILFKNHITVSDSQLTNNSNPGNTDSFINYDLDRCKDQWKYEIRMRRESPLQQLDVKFQRLLETSSDTSGVVARKQYLRDLPSTVDSKTSLTEVKSVWDSDLGLILGDLSG